jgi:hypothetical protein
MATAFYPNHFSSVRTDTDRAMHWRFQGTWDDLIDKARKIWNKLSEDDLDVADDSYDELIGRINRRSGESRASVHTKLFRQQ